VLGAMAELKGNQKQPALSNPKRIPEFQSLYAKDAAATALESLERLESLETIVGDDVDTAYSRKNNKAAMCNVNGLFGMLKLQEGFQEGLEAAKQKKSSSPAPALDTKQTVGDLLKGKKNKFVDKVKTSFAASVAAREKKELENKNKTAMQSVNDEIGSLLDSIDALSQKDLSKMFDIDISEDNKLEKGVSDMDTKKVVTQVNSAVAQLTNIIKSILKKGSLLARLGAKKTQSFMLSWNENVRTGCYKMAQALTGGNATDTEVNVFVDQTQKFCTAFLIWMFVMNWYFVTFFIQEDQRYAFDHTALQKFSITLYALFGPSYRALQCFNWALVEVPSMLRYVLYKKVIFVLMMLFFTTLVASNFHTTILTDFFNSLEGRYSTSVFCVFAILIVLAYALWFVGKESGWHEWMNVFRNVPGTVAYFFIVLIYLIFIATIGIPLAMLFVSAFFVFYSFLAIFVYTGSNTLTTFAQISDDISNLSEVVPYEFDSKNGSSYFELTKLHIYLWNLGFKGLRVIYAYAFELILLYILLLGISKYRNAFQEVLNSKVAANEVFSKSGPLANSFKNLFTWLLIINILLVIVIVVWMIGKWNTIEMLKCKDDTLNKPWSFSITDKLKSAKDFVGKNVTNLAKQQLGKTPEQLAKDKATQAIVDQAKANPGDLALQRQAQEAQAKDKIEREQSMKESWANVKQDVGKKWLSKDAWTPSFMKKPTQAGGGDGQSSSSSMPPTSEPPTATFVR